MPPATVPLINTVPSVEFVMVSSFSNMIPVDPVTSNDVLAVTEVNAPVEAEFAPIAAPSIVPPSISIELSVPKEVTLGCDVACRVPVRLPLKLVAEIVPVEGLYVASPSDSKLIVPPSKSASAAKINALPSMVFSLWLQLPC